MNRVIDSLTIVDPYTINIHAHRLTSNDTPWASEIIQVLNNVFIYSAYHLEKYSDEELRFNPMGTGPYYVYKHQSDNMVLRKNIYHRDYRRNRRSPDIIKIVHVPCLEQQFYMLKDNEVDLILQLPVSVYHEVFTTDVFQVFTFPSHFKIFLVLDTVSPVSPHINLPVNPLLNVDVRRAIAHSLDIDSYIEKTLYGRANRLVIPAIRDLVGYPTHLDYYKYDVEYSRFLMAKAGFGDGFSMIINTLGGQFTYGLSLFIKESLSDINIDVTIDLLSIEEYVNVVEAKQPVAFISSLISTPDRDSIIISLSRLFASTRAVSFNRFTRMNKPNPAREAILERLRVMSEYDIRRAEVFRELTDMIYDEVLIIPFFQPYNFYLLNKAFSYEPSIPIRFVDFKVR